MESREMVQLILFAGQQEKHRHREEAFGHSGGQREWYALRE